jgi:hypothetical protein
MTAVAAHAVCAGLPDCKSAFPLSPGFVHGT